MKNIIIFLSILFVFTDAGLAHSGNPKYHVIIDTDGALDDMRAITMLLSCNDVRVLAITCSEGTLAPGDVVARVMSLLAELHHEGIPVGVGQSGGRLLPEWSAFVRSVDWASEPDGEGVMQDYAVPDATSLLNRVTSGYGEPVTLIALGSLENFATWLEKYSEKQGMIGRILWFNEHLTEAGFNYTVSPGSYDRISASGILLDIVSGPQEGIVINSDYIAALGDCGSKYAHQIAGLMDRIALKTGAILRNQYMWDDLVALYLTVPILFEVQTKGSISYVAPSEEIPGSFLIEAVCKMLDSSVDPVNKVFKAFPADPWMYRDDYASMVTPTIERYGIDEWKSVVLTNEIHGHTGIYSIIGAKMGCRALEYFRVGENNLGILSYAGNIPPLSCFNDGLQISTGATIGQGLIAVSDSVSTVPSAIFEFNHTKVRITVREALARQMEEDIAVGVKTHGPLTDQYWLYIEDLAKRYWEEYDRHEIFLIEPVE